MTITVDAKNFKLTQALREYAHIQANKLSKLSKKLQYVSIYLENIPKHDNDKFANTVTIEVGVPGKRVVIKTHGIDMYGAITMGARLALRRVRKTYEKRRDKRRVGIEDVALATLVV